MAYTDKDYTSKKALREDFNTGKRIHCYQPGGMFPLSTGRSTIEGPHYPKPHKWYASVLIDENGYVTKILG